MLQSNLQGTFCRSPLVPSCTTCAPFIDSWWKKPCGQSMPVYSCLCFNTIDKPVSFLLAAGSPWLLCCRCSQARHDAPHSVVAKFNRNVEFNMATPLKAEQRRWTPLKHWLMRFEEGLFTTTGTAFFADYCRLTEYIDIWWHMDDNGFEFTMVILLWLSLALIGFLLSAVFLRHLDSQVSTGVAVICCRLFHEELKLPIWSNV